jgi:arylsulfatase B
MAFLAGAGLAVADERPNILLIMTDDQGNNLGYLGNPHLETPHIDALAAESVRFTNFHQENKCTNTRASLLTGKYSHKTGAWRTSKGRSMMRAENITLAEALRDAGYRTGHFGKWHLGEEWPYRPQDQGFEKTVHHKTGGVSQVSDYWGNDYFDDTYYDGDVPTPYQGYVTNVFFGEAMKFVAEPSDKPFFAYLALNVTHLPLNVDKKYSQPYVDKGLPSGVSQYYGIIDNLDENFGDLAAFLKDKGLDENTIVIFTTDDGAGAKGSRYEGGHRVFFNMKFPGSGLSHDNNTLVSVMDVFPTLLELAGAEAEEPIDGRSFVNWIDKPLAPEDDERPILINYFNPKDMHSRRDASVIWKNWRLTNARELYDIDTDMAQRHDVSAENPDLVEKLNGFYDAWDSEARPYLETITRFQIGHPDHPVIEMTTQDSYTVKECNAFNQGHVVALASCLAPHKVTFLRDGRYRFTFRRYPAYTGLPFGAKTKKYSSARLGTDFEPDSATLKVADQEVKGAVGAEDQSVSFDLEIKAGDEDVETWISGTAMGEDKTIPAYFLEVAWLGTDNSDSTAQKWQASWESLSQHRVPQWAKDAKFGIYAHWGVYAVSGAWDRTKPNWGNYYILPYRGIYDLTGKDETFGLFEKNVGPVREGYGYKDLAQQFKPVDFDPEEWVDLIVK